MQKFTLKNNIPVYMFTDDKYACTRISIHMALPRSCDTAHLYALLGSLFRRGCDTCPTFAEFNRRLYDLYGASFACHIETVGNLYILNLAAQTIDDSYAFSGEAVAEELCTFLCDMLLCHSFDVSLLSDTDIEIEKQNLIDDIRSVINNKRAYLLRLCSENIFAGTPMAVSKYGREEDVRAITRDDLKSAFEFLLQNASVYITVVGKNDRTDVVGILSERLSHLPAFKEAMYDIPAVDTSYRADVHPMNVTQSKMAICFMPSRPLTDRDINAMRVALVLLSKMPTSRLFMNVREKLSLCYYCDARFNRITGLFTVDMGLSAENIDAAREAIFAEINDLKAGNIGEEEYAFMQKFIQNSYITVTDSESELDAWVIGQLLQQQLKMPDEVLKQLLSITPADISAVLGKFTHCFDCRIIPQKEVQQ